LSNVFVVDTNKQPLNTIHPGEARLLLSKGKASVLKKYPFTIILKVVIDDPVVADLRIKIDPGSKTTGIAIMDDATGEVVFAAELTHRGEQIKKSLDDRRGVRRGRRNRHTRYRKARWQNRGNKKAGWFAPSLQSRISNIITWVERFRRVCPITNISMERVKFDMQLIKTHWIDAACVGKSSPEQIEITSVVPLLITAYGHGCRQMCLMSRYGFPRTDPKEKHPKHGFKTDDIVKAIVPAHLKRAGTHIGRMSAKASGSFTIATKSGTVTDVGKNYCRKLQRADGYEYSQRSAC